MKNVRRLSRYLRKERKAITSRRAGEGMRCDVKLFEILRPRVRFLQQTGVLAQILEVVRSLLKEEFDRFLIWPTHRLPSITRAALRLSAKAILR